MINSTTQEQSITEMLQSISDPSSSFLVSNLFFMNIYLLEEAHRLNLNITIVLFNIGESDLSFYIKTPELLKNVYLPGTFFKIREKRSTMTLIRKISNSVGDADILYDEYFNTVYETISILYDAAVEVGSLYASALVANIHSEVRKYTEGDVKLLGSNYLSKYPGLLHLNYKDNEITREMVYDFNFPILAEPWISPVLNNLY